MEINVTILVALRAFLVVGIVSLGIFLLSTSNVWAVFLGFALIYVAFLADAALRVKAQDLKEMREAHIRQQHVM